MDRGIRQTDLARSCEISPSYLNLIEHNRRKIGGSLLNRIAEALGTDASDLSGGTEGALVAALDVAGHDEAGTGAELSRTMEFAGRFPGWARLVERQLLRIRRLERVVEALNDRLTHDPYLSASMHDVLSNITAIRSASAILSEGGEIAPEWQARFHRNIYEDSQRLAETAEALLVHLDSGHDSGPSGFLPQEELDAWLSAREWRVPELELDPDADIGRIIDEAEVLTSNAARELAGSYLVRYASDAGAVPPGALRAAMAENTSAAGLANLFGVGLPVIYRRLAALPSEQQQDFAPIGLVACDASGALIFRKPARGFDLPRYSAACPLWPLFIALQRPMMPIRQHLRMATREEGLFEVEAIAEVRYPSGYDRSAVAEAWMLIRPVLGLERHDHAIPVGTTCRICAETGCAARREPSILAKRAVASAL